MSDAKENEENEKNSIEKSDDADWRDTLQRLGISDVDLTSVTVNDVLYLAKRWQFLQVIESTGLLQPFEEPQFLKSKSGWTIHYYGDAMCTSPGRLMFGGGFFRWSEDDDDEGGGGGIVNPGKGTIIKQAFDAACDIIQFAQQLGWKGVLIVDGHPDMQRAAWIEAVRIGVRLDGYQADMAAEKQRRRIVSPSIARMQEVIAALSGGGSKSS